MKTTYKQIISYFYKSSQTLRQVFITSMFGLVFTLRTSHSKPSVIAYSFFLKLFWLWFYACEKCLSTCYSMK